MTTARSKAPQRPPKQPGVTSIVEALDDPRILGAALKDPETFFAWRTAMKALFGLPMNEEEYALYRACTGRSDLPTKAFAVLWLIVGRRAGKSFFMALTAVYLAIFRDWRRFLSPGERAVILVVAADREQAKVIRRYVSGILANPIFSKKFVGETAKSIDLTGNVVIEVATCSYRTVRGRSICVALLDEVAFWRSESTANPDKEVWRAIRAGMASFGSEGVAIIASSPYARKGLLYEGYKKYFAKADPHNLVWQAATRVMNPTIPEEFIREEFEADPTSAEAEYNANFRTDVESFISLETLMACVDHGLQERLPTFGVDHVGFVDAAGGSGSDSMTMSIAHAEGDLVILDVVREVKPPFSPELTAQEFAALFKTYGITNIEADRWGSEFVVEAFARYGVYCEQSAKPKSEIYRESLPIITSGRARLLDHQKLINQISGLERRTARGGRDSIDHAPAGHDDVANAACGAFVKATRSNQKGPELLFDSVGTNRSRF